MVAQRRADRLVASGLAELGECEQVTVCRDGKTASMDPAKAEKLIAKGRASLGPCEVDLPVDADGKVEVCTGGYTRRVLPRRAAALLRSGTELGACEQVEVCRNGRSVTMDPAKADRLIARGSAKAGACPDYPVGEDGLVSVCRDGSTRHVSQRRAHGLIARGRAELGACGDPSDGAGDPGADELEDMHDARGEDGPPDATPGLGGDIVLPASGLVEVGVFRGDAAYRHRVFLTSPDSLPGEVLFDSADTSDSATFDIGEHREGTAIRLMVEVTPSRGRKYELLTGPGGENPDGLPHFIVEGQSDEWDIVVRCEDLLNLGDRDFNDLLLGIRVSDPPCARDSDSDGVGDCDDACPGTAGAPDGSGCDCSQRGDCDGDGDGVADGADLCPDIPGDGPDGCVRVTLSADAGPDRAAVSGDIVSVVGRGAVLTGDPDVELVYEWKQVGGDAVRFEFSSPPLTVYTEDASGDLAFLLVVSTADGSARADDEFVISVQPPPAAAPVELSSGTWHNMLRFDDGTVRYWGWNKYGQLGDGSLADGVADADGTALGTLVAKGDGTAWIFGLISDDHPYPAAPTLVSDGGIAQVGGLETGGILLRSDGTVLGFGSPNWNCELAGTDDVRPADLTPIPGLPTNIVAIDSGLHHNVALDAAGTAWVWGWSFGCTPRAVLGNVTAVSAGGDGHFLFLRGDGTAWAMGFNSGGQLGNGTRTTNYSTATQVRGLAGVVAVAAGSRHSLFVLSDGSLWACGESRYRALGLTDAELTAAGADLLYGKYLSVPKRVGLEGVALVSAGYSHSAAVLDDGTVWVWGYNSYGQLSNGTQTSLPESVPTPAQVDLGE